MARRLQREFDHFDQDPVDGLSRERIGGDLFHWQVCIIGPDGTPYAEGKFVLDLIMLHGYPLQPPQVSFVTPIFHTNVNSDDGQIRLDLLGPQWTPACTIRTLCEHVRALFGKADPEVNPNSEASRMFSSNPWDYLREARRHSQIHASAPEIASWNYFPMLRMRTPLQNVVVRCWSGQRHIFQVCDATIVAELKLRVSASQGPPPDQFSILGRGLHLSDDQSLLYYGLSDNVVLTMAFRSNFWASADIINFIYGPGAPLVVATIYQVLHDDGRVDIKATSMNGAEMVTVTTTSDEIFSTVYNAIIEKFPSAHGRLRLVTPEGAIVEGRPLVQNLEAGNDQPRQNAFCVTPIVVAVCICLLAIGITCCTSMSYWE